MKKYLVSFCCCFLLWSCGEFSYLINENCLKCSYQTAEKKISKEICEEDIENPNEKEEMREQMQMEADSLGVELSCQSN